MRNRGKGERERIWWFLPSSLGKWWGRGLPQGKYAFLFGGMVERDVELICYMLSLDVLGVLCGDVLWQIHSQQGLKVCICIKGYNVNRYTHTQQRGYGKKEVGWLLSTGNMYEYRVIWKGDHVREGFTEIYVSRFKTSLRIFWEYTSGVRNREEIFQEKGQRCEKRIISCQPWTLRNDHQGTHVEC